MYSTYRADVRREQRVLIPNQLRSGRTRPSTGSSLDSLDPSTPVSASGPAPTSTSTLAQVRMRGAEMGSGLETLNEMEG